MSWDPKYRRLEKGEVIQLGDEADICRDGWRDGPKWASVSERMVGKVASDPDYPSHTTYRRLIEEPADEP